MRRLTRVIRISTFAVLLSLVLAPAVLAAEAATNADPIGNPVIVLLGSLFPLIIAVVKQSAWSPQVNALVALIGYVAAGLIGTAMTGLEFTPENAGAIIAQVTIIGTVAYQLIWSNLGKTSEGAKSIDESITAATSIIK